MARQKRCPDGGEKKKKKTDDDKSKRHGEGSGRGRSNHAGDKIGKFKADTMAACIVEINFLGEQGESRGEGEAGQTELKESNLQETWLGVLQLSLNG